MSPRVVPPPGFPWSPRTVDVLDSHMSVVDLAADRTTERTVVMVHGNPTWGYLWRKVVPEVSGRARVVVPDLIGHGSSGRPDLAYRYDDQQRYFDAFMDALGAEDIVLVLHDWGGALGIDWASRHPDVVAGLALMEARIVTYPTWDDVSPLARERFARLRDPDLGWSMTVDDDVFCDVLSEGIPDLTAAELAAYRRPHLDPASRRPLLAWVREIPIAGVPADVAARIDRSARWLRTTNVPKLLLTVEPGAIIQAGTAREAIDRWPAVSHVHLGRGGHFVPDEHGAAVARHLVDWLG